MANRENAHLRNRVISEFEYMVNLSPSKLARYLRMRLAHNQGCPPANLLQVFSMCGQHSTCDECWWTWLCDEHKDERDPTKRYPVEKRCWDCMWGAKGMNCHPFIACGHPKFKGAIMDPDDFCSFWDKRYDPPVDEADREAAERLVELNRETAPEVGEIMKRKYELKEIRRELERRRGKKGVNSDADLDDVCEQLEREEDRET